MIFIFIATVVIALGVIFAVLMAKSEKSPLSGVNAERSAEREERLGKVMELFADGKEVSNNDVERALGVGDSTAESYLAELEKAGKIEQIGDIGRGVKYRAR